MARDRSVALAAALAFAGVTGCTILLGENQSFHEVDGGGGGAASAASSTSGSSASSGSGTSGTGGMPPTSCSVLKQDCGAGMRCTITDASKGVSGCVPVGASPLLPHDACPGGDGNCPKGTWCDGRTKTCAPFCASAWECGSGASCVAASNGMGAIPNGFDVCTAHCNPETAAPCGTGATCAFDNTALDFDCFLSGGKKVNDACQISADCSKGLACGIDPTTMTGACLLWCKTSGPPAGDCPSPYTTCNNFSPPFTYGGQDYGYCN